MIELVGQTKLLNLINSYTLDTVPRSLMLIGDEGCGKRTFATQLANNLSLELCNISENCSDTDLLEYMLDPVAKLYLIDLRNFLEKEQNKFLKFIEEPSQSCFIVVLANSEIGVLDTILNRCVKLHFSQYTFSEMKQIANVFYPNFNELDYQVCKTPGKLLELDTAATLKIKQLCESILTIKQPIAYGRFLDIFTKINCYENYDQYNFNAFFNMLAYVAFTDFAENNNEHSYDIYKTTDKYLKSLALAPKINRHDFILSFLTTLYSEVIV